jgi:type IV secretory pathway VirB6-like protein
MHIGDSKGHNIRNSPFFNQSCPAAGLSFMPPPCPGNCFKQPMAIYFKIIDRYYQDNLGGYTIEFIQGARKTGGGAITKFVGTVQLLLCNVSKKIYSGLVEDSNFIQYIRAILLLYIILLGFSSAMGFSSLSHKDLLIRVLKIGLITQLISTTSWEFFNTHFFKLFTDGIGVIISIIFGQSEDIAPVNVSVPWLEESSCNFQTLSGFSVFDKIFSELFSRETTRKVLSLLVWRLSYGFLFIAVIYICLAVVLFTVVKCILIYVVSFLIISILIVLAPIFISFILFDFTRSFFDSWLQTILSYFVQPIIILTFAFFLLQVFQAQLHSMLGYRVCWKQWGPRIPVINLSFMAWQSDYNHDVACLKTPNSILAYETGDTGSDGRPRPSPIKEFKPGDQLKFAGSLNIETYPGNNNCGEAGGMNESGRSGLCTPYNCSQTRFIGYPYINPFFPPDDSRRHELAAGTLVSFRGLIVFVLIVWFMYQFSKTVPDIAKQVAKGALMGGTNLGAVGNSMMGGMGWAAGLIGRAGYRGVTGGRSFRDDVRVARQTLKGLKENIQDRTAENLTKAKAVARAAVKLTVGAAANKLDKTIKNRIDNIDNRIENKLASGLYSGAKMLGKSSYSLAKGAHATTFGDYTPGKVLEKFGQATFGRAKAVDIRKELREELNKTEVGKKINEIEKGMSQLGERFSDWRHGTKRPERISKTAQEELDRADAATARADAAKADKAAARARLKDAKTDADRAKARDDEKQAQDRIDKASQDAVKAYEKAVKEGSTKAMTSLSNMYANGEGVDQNLDEGARLARAMELNQEAIQKGDESARAELRRLDKAIERYNKAQLQRDVERGRAAWEERQRAAGGAQGDGGSQDAGGPQVDDSSSGTNPS